MGKKSKTSLNTIFYVALALLYIVSYFSKEISSFYSIPFSVFGSTLLIINTIVGCIFYKRAILGLGVGALTGFFMFSLTDISRFMDGIGKNGASYPDFLTSLIPLTMVFSFSGLFILFNILRVSRSLESLVVYIARLGLRGRKSAKFITFILGLLFFTGGTTSSAAVSAVMKDIALKYITPEELSAIVDMTAAPVALIFQKFSYWGILLTTLLITQEVPFLMNEELAHSFINKIVLTIFIFPNFLIIFFALLLSLDLFPKVLLSKYFNNLIEKKKKAVKKEKNIKIEIRNKPSRYLAFAAFSSLAFLFILSATIGFQNALVFALCYSVVILFGVFSKGEKGADRLISAIEEGLFEATPILLILYLAGFVSTFLNMTGLPGYLAETVAGNINYLFLPLIVSAITFGIAYASGTSFGTYKIMLSFVPALAYNVAMASGLSPDETYTYLQIVIGGVLVTSVQADLSSFVSDTTIVAARGSGCSVISHFITQMPIVAYVVGITLVMYTVFAFVFI